MEFETRRFYEQALAITLDAETRKLLEIWRQIEQQHGRICGHARRNSIWTPPWQMLRAWRKLKNRAREYFMQQQACWFLSRASRG